MIIILRTPTVHIMVPMILLCSRTSVHYISYVAELLYIIM